MDRLTLLETLKSKSMTLSLEDIQGIMDEELNKNPEEMDAELIDLCADGRSEEHTSELRSPR